MHLLASLTIALRLLLGGNMSHCVVQPWILLLFQHIHVFVDSLVMLLGLFLQFYLVLHIDMLLSWHELQHKKNLVR